ncbi:hypothetical protein THIOSC15_1210002 [uncultured Thiomicrorhabdus sp.]
MYDFSQLTLSEGVRISVVIPKDPSIAPVITDHIDPWDTQTRTVIFDRILGDSAELLAGTFDVLGPINLEGDSTGTSPLRNNVHIYVHSAANGTNLASSNNISYSMWFTDA